jgi:hypothetical protein
MPRISEFFGIVIQMYHREDGPPHFHATYGGETATVGIDPVELLEGHLPPRQLRLVLEWAGLRRTDLMRNWERARNKETLERIEPLP